MPEAGVRHARGEGDLAAAIARRKLEVTGVELNAAKVRLARERYPGIRFIEGDICRLDLAGAQFDTVVIAEVLEHVPEDVGAQMLEKAWEALKPGGRLLVSVPNEDCVPHPNHVREFDRRALRRLLAPLGRPRIAGDQPFKWLLMDVRKPA